MKKRIVSKKRYIFSLLILLALLTLSQYALRWSLTIAVDPYSSNARVRDLLSKYGLESSTEHRPESFNVAIRCILDCSTNASFEEIKRKIQMESKAIGVSVSGVGRSTIYPMKGVSLRFLSLSDKERVEELFSRVSALDLNSYRMFPPDTTFYISVTFLHGAFIIPKMKRDPDINYVEAGIYNVFQKN